MTVQQQIPINTYTFAGSYVFVYAFRLLAAADLVVSVDATAKTLNVDYTVAGVGLANGGAITYLKPLQAGQVVKLQRVTSIARQTDYQNNGDFLAATVNDDFDRAYMALQEFQASGTDAAGPVQATQAAYAYAVTYDRPPDAFGFTVQLPKLIAQFGQVQVVAPATSYTVAPSVITDVWLTPNGVYHYESVALNAYTLAARFDDWLHVARLQSSATKIQGVYLRRPTQPLRKAPAARPFTDYHFKRYHVVPGAWVAWVDNAVVTRGQVLRTSDGNLWSCEVAGTAAGTPATPTYTEEGNSGFALVASGTASFSFRGRSAHANTWRVSPRGGVSWYFAHIAAGLLAARFPVETKAHLLSTAFHAVNLWLSGSVYAEGRLVGGSNTQGMVWEAQVAGTAGATIPFPVSPVVGTTCTDNGITWKAIGACAWPAQRMFWYDTDPTLRLAKSPDSHDSYAACYVWAVWRYVLATNDTAWLSTPSPHTGYTYAQLLQEIIYSNLSTQIQGTNLTRVFQGDGVPFGGSFAANYLEDNCEVWAGYYAAQQLWGNYLGDSAYATAMGNFANQVTGGLEALWEESTGSYKYIYGLDTMAPVVPGNALYYPLVQSQTWPWLWGVPLDTERKYRSLDYAQTHYPYWWARNDIDDILAIGAHFGLMASNPSGRVRAEILNRIDNERLIAGQSDLYVMDAAYYLLLRDNLGTADLTHPDVQYQVRQTQGAFTPGVTFGGNAVGLTVGAVDGRYVQAGKQINFWAYIPLTNKGSSTGAARVTLGALPAPAANFAGASVQVDAMTGLPGVPVLFIVAGSAAAELRYFNGTTSEAASLANTHFNNTTTLYITGSYLAA